MLHYIIRRTIFGFVTIFLITIGIYFLIWLAPGDPVDFLVNPSGGGSLEQLERLREELG